ncbi:MAG: hypothetical protein IPL95_16720 [Saprospiraceae bacterium]|nr:hypothetical protein [Saprospiraceae bacterium]
MYKYLIQNVVDQYSTWFIFAERAGGYKQLLAAPPTVNGWPAYTETPSFMNFDYLHLLQGFQGENGFAYWFVRFGFGNAQLNIF